MNTKEKPLLSDQELERVARQLRPYLDAGAGQLKPGIAYRLQSARRAALAQLDGGAEQGRQVNADGSLTAWAGWQARLRDWRFWALGLAVACALSLYGANEWRTASTLRETVDLDLLLLADDLPVDAFLDRGFHAFLQSQQ